MQVPVSLSKSLEMDRPIYMGNSIGGHLAADLSLHYTDKFRAIIGLEAALYTPYGRPDVWNDPRVSNAFKSMSMYGLMAPTAPEKYRRETLWVCNQGAPPVFKGDLYYYSVDHDLQETAQQIDTSQVGVYLLTGEYDWASTPERSEELAAPNKGAKYLTMQGLGHFPMSEDPERCLEFVEPILNDIWESRFQSNLQT